MGIGGGYRFELKGDLVEATGVQRRTRRCARASSSGCCAPQNAPGGVLRQQYQEPQIVLPLRGAERTHDDGNEIFQRYTCR